MEIPRKQYDRLRSRAHGKLTSVVGRLMAETGKVKTYSDAIEVLLSKHVVLLVEQACGSVVRASEAG